MRNLKKIFMYLMLIFIFSLTFSSEDSKIYLNEKRREPAKLTIGVTKLKTKELPMDFNIEQKIIYAELPNEIGENDLIFVSETLDEIPSLSTTNGRRSINNIKKYLTKDIKVGSKFNYKTIVGNKENGIEEGKRYLVIKCKTNLSGVYVYVVERGSYKVKEVYRGKFEELYFQKPRAEEKVVRIENPIVQYEKDGEERNLGRVFISGTSTQTVDKNGGNYDINGQWISGNITGMYFNNGNYNIKLTSPDAQDIGDGPVLGGTSARYYVDFKSQNETMWQVISKEQKLVYGVHTYNFKKGTYTLKVESYNKSTGQSYQVDTFKVEFPDFDGTVYLDKNLDIGKTSKFEKEYEIYSAPNGKIFLGSVGLKSLDRRITYNQNGGDGVSVRLLSQDVILKKENSEYTIRGTLTIEENDSKNNEVRGANREDTSARKGNVYLTFDRNEEEKLVAGGKYHILTADSKEPLQVGVKANTGEFLKPVSELWLVTTQKYYKTNINFKNDEMPLINEKGWIDYETGVISGYAGNWGEIIGESLTIPEGTTDIYLLDETGKKLTSGESWEYDIPIGKSQVTLKFDGKKLKFGVKEGNYFIGERGKFFLRYVSKTNYLKLEEVNVEFILNKLTSKATIEFLNPMMRVLDIGTGIVQFDGMVSFGKGNPNGQGMGDGNHSYSNGDEVNWWKVTGAGEYDINSYHYKIYTKDGKELKDIPKGNNVQVYSIEIGGIQFAVSFSNNKNMLLGIYNYYKGNRIEETIYLAGYNDDGIAIRYDEIKIVVDEFEPNAYGKVIPVENGIPIDNKERQVGTGIENLKNNVQENVLIDLGTNFRFYSRFRGVINLRSEYPFELTSVENVIIKNNTDNEIINGRLVLVKDNQENTIITMKEETNISASIPEYYNLKVELTPSEYQKLKAGTTYEVFKENQDYHTLIIGLNNEKEPWRKNLIMDKPLNFRTTGASIEIKVENDMLDFGKININQNKGKPIIREGYTYVTVIGNEINDFSVTPNNEEEGNTEIYLKNPDETLDKSKKLQVSKLKAEQVYEKKEESKLTRIYNFNGIVTVPLDSNVGEYLGETVINVTIIN